MRLKRIILINRAPFEYLDILVDDVNVLVLSGINGNGKTTILSYITDAMYELARQAYRNDFENREEKFYRISSDIYAMDSSRLSIVYLRFCGEDGNAWDYVDLLGDFTKEEYENHITLQGKIPAETISRFMKEGKVYKGWSQNNKQTIEHAFANNIVTYFPAYRYEIPYYLNTPYKEDIKYQIDSYFDGSLINPIEVTSDLPQIANWIMDVVLDNKLIEGNSEALLNALDEVIDNILISKFNCKTNLGIGPRTSGASRISIKCKADNKVVYPSIFNMSSGELALLCLFGELIRQTDRLEKSICDISGIVLVDEADKHLHIKLQKEVIPKLISLFPNLQFIISTHSPFLGLGLEEKGSLRFQLCDLDNQGFACLPYDNDLFLEVYNMIVEKNEAFYSLYCELKESIEQERVPLIITEGKTDWKHIIAAKEALGINNVDVEFLKYETPLGDKTLLSFLRQLAAIRNPRKVIGIFDRDNFSEIRCKPLEENRYVSFGNNVFGFAIPLVNADEYGEQISIEHYYNRADLTKKDCNGRRLFLGEEFYESGIHKERPLHTKARGFDKKARINGIIDEKVYDIKDDPQEKNSLALSKNDFAEMILHKEEFSKDFNFCSFQSIFEIICEIASIT